MDDLFSEMLDRLDICEKYVDEMHEVGVKHAEKNAEYRKAVREYTMREQARGTAATLTSDLVRGRPDVARLGVERDCAENDERAYQEAININKLRVRVLNAQLEREWGQAGRGV